MDERLVAWARAVKSRRRHRPGGPPPLWLFTDPARMADPVAAIRRLPRGLCGVVLRHDADGCDAVVQRIARLCRERRLALSVAAPLRPVAGTARHARRGMGPTRDRRTASAHGVSELVRARGCWAVFLSPVFPTRSHPGAPALGAVRWAAMARHGRSAVLALGGVSGLSAGRLGRAAAGAGAIGALLV